MPEQIKKQQTSEIILQMKKVKEEQGLTLKNIFDKVNKNGIQVVSESTIRRVFAENSENQNFDYEETVMPIASAILMTGSDEFDHEKALIYYEQRNGLREVVRLHHAEEDRLKELLNETKTQFSERLHSEIQNIKEIYEERCRCQRKTIDTYESINLFLQRTIDRLLEAEDADRKYKWDLHNEIQALHDELNKLKKYHIHESN